MTVRLGRLGSRGVTTLEFAIIGLCLLSMSFGIIELGLVWWAKTGLQIVASGTARCGAISSVVNATNLTCSTTSGAQTFATNSAAARWALPVNLTASQVTIINPASGCGSANPSSGSGRHYYQVNINSALSVGLPPPFSNLTSLSVTGCFPVS